MQQAYKFDKETLIKIAKGAIIASAGAAGLAFFDYVGTINVDDPVLASFLVWALPVCVNAIKEWKKGKA